jgi:hypothetical protein
MRLRIGMSAAAAIVVGAIVCWAARSEPPLAQHERLTARESRPAIEGIPGTKPDIAPARENVQAVAADPEASTIAQYASEKYQFLFDDLRYLEARQIGQLREALQMRERLAGEHESAGQKEALASVEDQIRGILRPADHATYEMLRESDLEQFKLNEYAGGIGNVAPLSAADRETILKTKLAYKARFRQLLRDSGVERGDLSAAEREYAYSVASQALADFSRGYLQEVRQYLANEEQYALLSNYEATEFKAELAQLQSMVNTSSEGGS